MSFTLRFGSAPLVVSMPHIGTQIPVELQADYVPRALKVEDTDWHLERLYNFLQGLDATVLQPRYSRYVIDLNRPPDDTPMYPGAANTELCPTRFFTGDALYHSGKAPGVQEVRRRLDTYWQPYHSTLAKQLQRLRELHGYVLLWDAHSIRSSLPWLFEGTLPGLNIGTADGMSAHPLIASAIVQACQQQTRVTHVLNGRFKGGYITRHYGDPHAHVHAVQMEMCWHLYMREEAPFEYDSAHAARIQPLLKNMMDDALAACHKLYGR